MTSLLVSTMLGFITVAFLAFTPSGRRNIFNAVIALGSLGLIAAITLHAVNSLFDDYVLSSLTATGLFAAGCLLTFIWYKEPSEIDRTPKVEVRSRRQNERVTFSLPAVQSGNYDLLGYLGFAGVALLLLGMFLPVMSAPLVGSVSLWTPGIKSDSLFLFFAAAASLMLLILKRSELLSITGLLSVGLLVFYLQRVRRVITLSGDSIEMMGATPPPEDPLGIAAGLSAFTSVIGETLRIRMAWGWSVLFLGAFIVLGVGVYALVKRGRPSIRSQEAS